LSKDPGRARQAKFNTMKGLISCLDLRPGWTITSEGWNFLKRGRIGLARAGADDSHSEGD